MLCLHLVPKLVSITNCGLRSILLFYIPADRPCSSKTTDMKQKKKKLSKPNMGFIETDAEPEERRKVKKPISSKKTKIRQNSVKKAAEVPKLEEPEESPFPTTIDLNNFIKMTPKPDLKLQLSKESLQLLHESDMGLFSSISNVMETGDEVMGAEEIRKANAPKVPTFSGLPGWGNWANSKTLNDPTVVERPKLRKEELKKKRLYIKEDVNKNPHQVVDVPFPFTSVKDFESSIRMNFSNEFSSRRAVGILARSRKKVDLELEETT